MEVLIVNQTVKITFYQVQSSIITAVYLVRR